MPDRTSPTPAYLLAGGGLQNCLLALTLLDEHPDARITLVERDERLGGNHTWSFHAADLPPRSARALDPIVHRSWDAYDVAFPAYRRTVASGYRTILSRELDAVLRRRLRDAPGGELLLGTEIESVGADHVTLAGGRTLAGDVVVDGRGLSGAVPAGTGYQKFVGLELRLDRPSSFERPMLMDARVPQIDGFRFMYVLPFAPDRVLVEDTRFSDSPWVDRDEMAERVLEYAAANELDVDEVVRTESGVLPMPWTTRPDWSTGPPLRGGYAGGFLHPATGFSFPVAARLARQVVDAADSPFDGWDGFVERHRRQHRFAVFLNRLAFTGYGPTERHHVFERFYRFDTARIERFYRLDMTRSDRLRLLLGRPPRGFSLARFVRHARGPAGVDDRSASQATAQGVG